MLIVVLWRPEQPLDLSFRPAQGPRTRRRHREVRLLERAAHADDVVRRIAATLSTPSAGFSPSSGVTRYHSPLARCGAFPRMHTCGDTARVTARQRCR